MGPEPLRRTGPTGRLPGAVPMGRTARRDARRGAGGWTERVAGGGSAGVAVWSQETGSQEEGGESRLQEEEWIC